MGRYDAMADWDLTEEWLDDGFDDLDELDEADDDDGDDVDEDLYDENVESLFESLTPAESFNVAKALGQIGKGAAQVFDDPTTRQIAGTALPIAGGALGTAIGGPIGTAVGTGVGSSLGKAIAPPPAPVKPPPVPTTTTAPATTLTPALTPKPAPTAVPPATAGSAAATKALVCSQQPDVLKALLALSVGDQGAAAVNGVPVGAVMNMLSSLYARAAEDAEDMLVASEQHPAYLFDDDGRLRADPASPSARADALYAALVDREDVYLAESGVLNGRP